MSWKADRVNKLDENIKMFPVRFAKKRVRMYFYRVITRRFFSPGVIREQVMSELSFQVFCIEFYCRHIQKPGPEVYSLFRESGLLDMLKKDYEDLHGMGQEALMQFSMNTSRRS